MNLVEHNEALMLSEEGLEIYVEMNDELRQTYKRMTKEEILADLNEPIKEIDADCAYLYMDVRSEEAVYWLRVSKDSAGPLVWNFRLAAVIDLELVNTEEEPCSQPT